MRTLLVLALTLMVINSIARETETPYSKSPTHYGFIENRGQVADQHSNPNPEVHYLLPARGMNVQLRANGFSYDVYRWHDDGPPTEGAAYGPFPEGEQPCYFHRIDVAFVGTDPDVQLLATERSTDYMNYYLAHLPEDGATYVHHYRRVLYKGLYPGIDVEFYVPEDGSKPVEYNIIVHPSGDPSRVKLRYEGAPVTMEEAHNRLKFDTRFGTMYELVPASWYEAGGQRQYVEVQYTAIDENTFGFSVPERPALRGARLVIDPIPVVVWATYFGGNHSDICRGIAADSFGTVYMVGSTQSANAIATSGAHQTTLSGTMAGFITSFDSTGVLQWGTYYGGNGPDAMYDIALSKSNHLYVCGETGSISGISTPGTHQLNRGGGYDGLIVKFNSAGVRIWGTYYGGGNLDRFHSIALDGSDNIFTGGSTSSISGIASPNAHQTTNSGGDYSGMLVKLDSNGIRLWATYYGGSSTDEIEGVATDSNGCVYIVGYTRSTTGIATTGSQQPNYGGDIADAFLARFDSNGIRLWGSYIGGTGIDGGYAVTYCRSGYIYFVGNTSSDNDIATPGAFQSTKQGAYSGFIAKMNLSGALQWASYFGGNNSDKLSSVQTDGHENVYVVGETFSNNLATPGATFPNYNSTNMRVYFGRFRSDGALLYCSYLPGNPQYTEARVVLSKTKRLFVASEIISNTSYATPGTHQTSFGGGSRDAFLSLIDEKCYEPPTSNSPVCSGDTLKFWAGEGNTYLWEGPNNFLRTERFPIISNPQINQSGTYTLTVSDTSGCSYIATTEVTVLPNSPIAVMNNSPVCEGDTLRLQLAIGGQYNWSGPGNFQSNAKDVIIPDVGPQHEGVYSVTVTRVNGCKRSTTATVVLHPPMSLAAGSNSPVCEGKVLQLTASGGATYQWTGPGGFGTNQANPVINNAQLSAAGTYSVVATDSAGCMDTAFVQVEVVVCTGIEPGGVPGLAVHPNPTSGLLRVSATGPLALLELYDIAGRMVLRQRPAATTTELDMSVLPSGTYLLHVHTHRGQAVRTVVKE